MVKSKDQRHSSIPQLQLKKANASETGDPILNLLSYFQKICLIKNY